jgi:hypothetical protein
MTKRAAIALCCGFLLAGAARAEENTWQRETSVSVGGGLAYEVLGLDVALRRDHLEGYVGIGLLSFLKGLAAGGRYYLRPDGNGFFLAVNLGAHFDNIRIDANDSTGGRLFWATFTPGYRLVAGGFFLQIAIGGGLVFDRTYWSTPPLVTGGWQVLPDAMLALGGRF